MRELFLIKDSLANKISYYHLLLLMASLPFDMFYSHIILISYGIHTLIYLDKKSIKPVFSLRTIALQSVFYVTVLSTIYAANTAEAFNQWGKHIAIFVFPLLCCFNPLDLKKYRGQLLLWFALVCTATIVYLFSDALITIRYYSLPFSTLFSDPFTNHNFSAPINMHATFFSMQVGLALVYILTVLIKERSFYRKLFYLLCSLILSAGLIQLSSKSVFVALIIIINFALPYFLLTGARRWKFLLITASVSVLAVIIILNTKAFEERYVNDLQLDFKKPYAGEAIDSRLARWQVGFDLVSKSPVIGYGAGSEIGLLQDAFFNKKLYNSYLNRLNVHSEYLSFLIKSGIIGLLIYLATLGFGFALSFRQKDLVFFTFMVLVAVVSFSENLLDVDKGTFYYAFFFTFFAFYVETKSKVFRPETTHFSVPENKDLVLI